MFRATLLWPKQPANEAAENRYRTGCAPGGLRCHPSPSAFFLLLVRPGSISPGEGGLAFLGVGGGVLLGTTLAPYGNKLYWRAMEKSETGKAPPEAYVLHPALRPSTAYHYVLPSRLYMPMMGALLCPTGLFWFAWYETVLPSPLSFS